MKEFKISKNGKKLRCGFTTGSCAAAAAKAAVLMITNKIPVTKITIDTPSGQILDLTITDPVISNNDVECAVIKDAGDDPDVTHGMKITARAALISQPEIKITGGSGIGRVTRPGLPLAVGNPAINPVPLKMIRQEVMKVLPQNQGVSIEISAPGGDRIARKTYNPQLGIIGGISILGTTGIVEPMSEKAVKESLILKLAVLKAEHQDICIFTPGNLGSQFISDHYRIPAEKVVTVSNYIGDMLEQAVVYGMKKILFIGYIGKLIKTAGGIFQTHSRIADARNEILAAHYGYYTGDFRIMRRIMESNTTEEAVLYIENDAFFNYIGHKIKTRCETYVRHQLGVEVILLSQKRGLLTAGTEAMNLLKIMQGKIL